MIVPNNQKDAKLLFLKWFKESTDLEPGLKENLIQQVDLMPPSSTWPSKFISYLMKLYGTKDWAKLLQYFQRVNEGQLNKVLEELCLV